MLSVDGIRRVLHSHTTEIGPDQGTNLSSVDPSLCRLVIVADGTRHALFPRVAKNLVLTITVLYTSGTDKSMLNNNCNNNN